MKRDGTLVAMEMEAIGNAGAYGNHSSPVMFFVGCFPLGLYRCPHQRFFGQAVYTNTMPAGAFRGYGATQGTFAVECQIDQIAHELKLDYLELLKRHLITPEDKILLGQEHEFHTIGSYGMPEAIKKVTQAMNYQPGTPPIVEGHGRRGIGFAASMLASGLANIHKSTVRIALKPNGRYEMRTGAVDVGAGSDKTLRQIAAEVLGTTVGEIDLIAADTQETPFDCGSYASGTIVIAGQAVNLAAKALRSRLLEVAAIVLVPSNLEIPSELELTGKGIQFQERIIDLGSLAENAAVMGESLEVEREFTTEQVSMSFSFLGVEVEVDTETGRITVLRCVQAVDLGQAINPRICISQVEGALVMGLGYALFEELRQDEWGQTLNPTFRTYRLPLAKDVPPLEVILVETADAYGPFGAKGVGEIGINCTAPAIANAVFHATGVRLTKLPMTPEKVWRALSKKGEFG